MTNAGDRAEKTYWVVVADESRAIFYTRDTRRAPLLEFLALDNEVVLLEQKSYRLMVAYCYAS